VVRFPFLFLTLAVCFSVTLAANDLKVSIPSSTLNKTAFGSALSVPELPGDGTATYSGTIRVYLVEPLARWRDRNGSFYHNGFLDFPVISNTNLGDGAVVYRTETWDAALTRFETISPTNIMAIGVIFRYQTVLTDADPPRGLWFQAHYADACAAATPGVPGRNEAPPGYTHTVFIEESTATW